MDAARYWVPRVEQSPMEHQFISRFGIGARVDLMFTVDCASHGSVVGVSFTSKKVTYDINLDVGGETMRNIDSCYVEPMRIHA